MSKARAKGTAGENYFLEHLRRMFGSEVERAPLKGIDDDGDFVNVPWQHEAKNTQRPLFLKWARVAQAKSTPWAILWKGDLRKSEGPFVLMDLRLYESLVSALSAEDHMAIATEAGEPV